MKTMNKTVKLLIFMLSFCTFYACDDDKKDDVIDIPEMDIYDDIIGEWVYDHPEENAWQSMKFLGNGSYFCYSDNKDNWSTILQHINEGNFGVKGMEVSAANGTTYLDMTVSKINGYQFTARLHETTVDMTFHKVVMRSHLNYGESIIPPYTELVDTAIIGYKSHDEELAIVDNETGEIRAVANNGRTYIDIITNNGVAVIKVMIGKINDGDENEVSPITKKTVTPPQPILNLSKAIIGTWIYDESYWESITFLENGKVYYSNVDAARGIYNENASGNYTVDSETNRLTLTVQPTGGTQMTVVMAMTTISKYSYTAKFYLTNGQLTGTFTYAKQINSINLECGDIVTPEYQNYVEKGTVITKYQSHNSRIAEVNSETGEITAKTSGRTYIDIVTEDGTAVFEINVNSSLLDYNYEEYVWVDKETIKKVFGDKPLLEDSKSLTYERSTGNFQYVGFQFDLLSGLVRGISLLPRADASFSTEQMVEYLTNRFTVFEKGTLGNTKAFINAESLDKANVGITFDISTKQLTYVQIVHDLFSDYSPLIGKTRSEVFEIMGNNPFTSSDEYVAYMVNSDYINYVMISFELYGVGIQNTVQGVVLSINSKADKDEIYQYLSEKFIYMKDYSSETEKAFLSSNGMIAIFYDTQYDQIIYLPNEVSLNTRIRNLLKQRRIN